MTRPLRSFYQLLLPEKLREELAITRGLATQYGTRAYMAFAMKKLGFNVASVQLSHGTFHVDLRDIGVGFPTYLQRQYEPKETQFLNSVVTKNAVVFDIGTNVGIMLGVLSRLVGEKGQVIGFEPDSYNYTLALRNMARNQLSNSKVLNVALGDKEGTLHVFQSPTNFGDHRVYQADSRAVGHEIPVRRVDDLVEKGELPRPNFIKMDVQGYEVHVLKGMLDLLRSSTNLTLLMEYWPHGIKQAGEDPLFIKTIMSDLGFHGFLIQDDMTLMPLDWTVLERDLLLANDLDNAYTNLVFKKNPLPN